MKLFPLPTIILTCLSLVACVPNTPQKRIENNPALYQQLPPKHQALVQQGKIDRGMTKEAVFLAWGNPTHTTHASFNGKESERWIYEGTQPVVTQTFQPTFGFISPYNRYYHSSFYGASFGPNITYVPTITASVWYLNQRVDAWEQSR